MNIGPSFQVYLNLALADHFAAKVWNVLASPRVVTGVGGRVGHKPGTFRDFFRVHFTQRSVRMWGYQIQQIKIQDAWLRLSFF